MVGVDVGYHRHHRLQVQEAGVAFVRFGDQVTAAAQLGIGTGRGQTATDDEGRIEPACCEHRSQQAGGGGLAMGSGDGDAMPIAHQLGEHLGPRHHRDALFQGQGHFRIGRIDRAGHHQHVGTGYIAGLVADEDLCAEALQTLGTGRFLEVRAGHLVAEIEQHFGDAAHADPTDANEMNAADAPHAAYFGFHRSGRLSHGPPPGRYRPRCGWRRAGPGGARWPPWP